MLTVTRRFKFDAAHHLPYYKGKCHNIHGHTYHLEVTVTGLPTKDKNDPSCGMIIDFTDLDHIVRECVVEKYDHEDLNRCFDNPTAELMVCEIAITIREALPKRNDISLLSVRLWETDNSYAEWTR